MKNPDLIAEQRTDKNGVTNTKWVKPQQPASASANRIPRIAKPDTRQENLKVIHRELDDNGMMLSAAKEMLETASNEEVAAVADAVETHGEDYVDSLISSAYMGLGAVRIADLALVYDPDMFPNFTGKRRDDIVLESIEKACILAGCGSRTRPLLSKSPEIIERTRNFVQYLSVASSLPSRKIEPEMIALVLGDTGRDPEEVRQVMKQHGATEVGQIEFILDDGMPVISDGAL